MTRYLGIDPGPTPGVAVLDVEHGFLNAAGVLQCSAGLLVDVLRGLVRPPVRRLAVERFVVRGRTTKDQALTRDQVARLEGLWPTELRTAHQVKSWASDSRLDAAGLLEACKGMRHARDAARHALFAAVHDGALPDPLSSNWRN